MHVTSALSENVVNKKHASKNKKMLRIFSLGVGFFYILLGICSIIISTSLNDGTNNATASNASCEPLTTSENVNIIGATMHKCN